MTLRLFARNVVTPEGTRSAIVTADQGVIMSVELATAPRDGALDLGNAWLTPGIVDTHVHVNEPGRTEWEGFETATRAAAAGGVTTIVDMPLNSIPATATVAALHLKRAAAVGKLHADVAFWGGVVPGNAHELRALAAAGVRGFKCFLVPSGVDEFPGVEPADLHQAMPLIADLGLPLLVHAELPGPIAKASAALGAADPRCYATWLASRPRTAEIEAVRLMISLAERYGCRTHIVHVATGEVIDDLRRARARNIPVTAETCPHYLTFCAEEIGDGATQFKCAPPIRERAERERLWEALAEGTIDLVATDHSPCPPELKCLGTGDFMAAWGGIASLELSLAAVWTAARARGFTPEHLARWMSAAPARLAGLADRKGAIAPGMDADLVVWDPNAEWHVDPARLRQRHAVTPYAGRALTGRVLATYLRGEKVWDGSAVGPAAGALVPA